MTDKQPSRLQQALYTILAPGFGEPQGVAPAVTQWQDEESRAGRTGAYDELHREEAKRDAALYGIGYLVDGRRIHPSRVVAIVLTSEEDEA